MSVSLYRLLLRKVAAACPTCNGTGQTQNPANPAAKNTAVKPATVNNIPAAPAGPPKQSVIKPNAGVAAGRTAVTNSEASKSAGASDTLTTQNTATPAAPGAKTTPVAGEINQNGSWFRVTQPDGTYKTYTTRDQAELAANKLKSAPISAQPTVPKQSIKQQADKNSAIVNEYMNYTKAGLDALQANKDSNSKVVGNVWNGGVGQQVFNNPQAMQNYIDARNNFIVEKLDLDADLRKRGIYGNVATARINQLMADGLPREDALRTYAMEEKESLQNAQWAEEDTAANATHNQAPKVGSNRPVSTTPITDRYSAAAKRSNNALNKIKGLLKNV